MVQLEQGFETSEMGFNGAIAEQQLRTPMSPNGHERHFWIVAQMSAYPSTAAE
jgi:hypothetical protein